uniref:arginine deiminase family protein n=1 Tax=Actinomyces sp. 217892 TaxID=2927827 RepID=UPI002030638A
MKFSVDSEIGELETVILHRPGKEMNRLTPDNKDELLFDDVLWLERAQQEHDQFAAVLKQRGVNVLYLKDLLTDTVKIPQARQYLLEGALTPHHTGHPAAPTV